MNSKYETGHAKNVANFEKMTVYCIGYGMIYQPSKTTIQIGAMQQLLADARNSLVLVTTYATAYQLARNARIAAFENLNVMMSRVANALAATDTTPKLLEDVRAVVRKIKGIRLSKKEEVRTPAKEDTTKEVSGETNEGTTPPNATNGSVTISRSHSAAQTSRDQQIEHVSRLLALLQNAPYYQPNEAELQIGSLQQYLELLRTTNSAVITAEVDWSNARLQRNALLYGEKTGIYFVAKDVKLYVKSVFGASSPQYKQISKLRFTRPR